MPGHLGLPFRRGDKGVVTLFFQTYCTRSPAPLSGCLVTGTACRPVRPSGHSPGDGAGGRFPPHQRRAVRATVREERVQAAGDEEPATISRASLSHQSRKRDQGDGAEHGRPSTTSREPGTSGAEAATERSEGVAGAERYQGPGQPAAGQALAASGASSGRRPEARSDVEQSLSHRPWEHYISLCIL